MYDRKAEEKRFHNKREVDHRQLSELDFQRRYSNKKWYCVTRKSVEYVSSFLRARCEGKVALDYCCGLGDMSLRLARNGAFVHGIDLSDESITTARQLLADAGYASQSLHQVMDAENLNYESDTFDLIVCSGVLHHLDLRNAYRELARVLKPTGEIICIEALGHNPIIQCYRRLTPHLRTAWEIDHILKKKDIDLAQGYFGVVRTSYFHLFSILAVPFRRTRVFNPLLSFLEGIDSLTLKLPLVQLMAWQAIFFLSVPKKK